MRVGPASAAQAVAVAPAPQNRPEHRRRERRREGCAAKLNQEAPPAGAALDGEAAIRIAAGIAQAVVHPANGHSPREERGEHPRTAPERPGRDPVQLLLDHQHDAAKHGADNGAQQQRRLIGHAKEPKKRGAPGDAEKKESTDRRRLIGGLGGRADVGRVERPRQCHHRIDAEGDD